MQISYGSVRQLIYNFLSHQRVLMAPTIQFLDSSWREVFFKFEKIKNPI